jgi:hypothetical protein
LKLEFLSFFLSLALKKGEYSTKVKEPIHKDEREQQQLGANEQQQVKRYLKECQQKHDNEE